MSRRIFIMVCLSIGLCACESATLAPVTEGWHKASATQTRYRVRKGDTLYSIAFAFGLDYRKIAAQNDIKSPYEITVGEHLRLAGRAKSTVNKPKQRKKIRRTEKKRYQRIERSLPHMSAWRWPAKGRIIDHYSANNKGIDIGGKRGESIRAANSGVIAYSGRGIPGYGNLIIVKHDKVYLSAYAHNARILVHEGDRVKAGQKIAEMGSTGAERVMLHFEIRKAGRSVNPLSYLPRGS